MTKDEMQATMILMGWRVLTIQGSRHPIIAYAPSDKQCGDFIYFAYGVGKYCEYEMTGIPAYWIGATWDMLGDREWEVLRGLWGTFTARAQNDFHEERS